ncbi:MAG: glycosyltransferase [Propionibacteriaceae bacterium]|jgi:poly(glycerol-phosphate) alpha-glucosyltransferase|nr:glycosyltransferase [Propionibacteriaceae bacterium]
MGVAGQAARLGKRALRKALKPAAEPVAPRHDPLPQPSPFPEARYLFANGPRIPRRYAGRTKSVMLRAKLFSDAGVPSEILLSEQYSSLGPVLVKARARGDIGADTGVVSMVAEVDEPDAQSDQPTTPVEIPGLEAWRDPDAEIYRYFDNGVYRRYRLFDDDGHLLLEDFFNDNRARTKRDEYDPAGRVARTTYYDLALNVPRQEVYFRADGTAKMTKWLAPDPDSPLPRLERATIFDHSGRPVEVERSDAKLFHDRLDEIIGGRRTFLVCDDRRLDAMFLTYARPNVKRIFVLHNPHLDLLAGKDGAIHPLYRALMASPDSADAVVFLTDAQRADAEALTGPRDHYFVIPHPIAIPEPSTLPRDPRTALMLTRFVPQKRLTHAVRAWAKVVQEVPDAKLDIFGFGGERPKVQALIDQLGVGASVSVNDYTTDPQRLLQEAAFTMLTSKFEGFGLSALESLAQGCPVVSYDVKYGPAEIIDDGVTGLLVPDGSVSGLAEACVKLLKNAPLRESMGAAGRESAKQFDADAYVARWASLCNRLDAQGWG